MVSKQCARMLLPLLALWVTNACLAAMGDHPHQQYNYTDEWSVVSAPPPAGPYRLVNIDPRVPGMGIIPPPVPVNAQRMQTDETVSSVTSGAPPAAGTAAKTGVNEAGPTSSLEQNLPVQLPPPGHYGQRMPPTGYNYPDQARQPGQATYPPPYGRIPPYGYYRSPVPPPRSEVPPPPVYDGTAGYPYPGGVAR